MRSNQRSEPRLGGGVEDGPGAHVRARPLIVGPWLSEVGFEILYWLPFLNWVKTYRHFDPERPARVSTTG